MSLSRDQQPPLPQPPVWVGSAPAYGLDPLSPSGMPAPYGAGSASGPPSRLNPLELLKALKRHWILAVTLGLLCSGTAAALAWKLIPNSTYTATSLVRVRSNIKSLLDTKLEDDRENKSNQKTQETLVKSMMVIDSALEEPKIAALLTIRQQPTDAALWLQDELKVDFAGDIMRISLSGEREKDVVEIVKAITDAYLTKIGNEDQAKTQSEIATLEELRDKYAERLKLKRENWNSLTKIIGANNQETLTLKGQLALQQEADLKKELSWASIERKRVEIEYNLKRTQARSSASEVGPSGAALAAAVEQALAQDPQVQKHQADILRFQTAIEHTSGTIKNPQNDPSVRKARHELEVAQKALHDYVALKRSGIEQQILSRSRGGAEAAPDELTSLAQKLEFYSQYEKVLKEQADSQSNETKETSDTTTRVLALQDEINQIVFTQEKIGARLEQLKVDYENKSKRIELIEKPTKARSPDGKRRLMMTGGIGVGTLALVLLGISLLEYRVRRIDSLNTVSQDLGLRLVGSLPATPSRSRFGLSGQVAIQDAYWRSRLNESVNAIRTMMLRQSQLERIQVVMVTSATVGEGKTSLACHLATSLARAGRRTLLLDCDLRSPTAHRVFDLPLEPGLSEVLRGQVALEEVSHPIALGDLRMITAGRCDLHSLHALGLEQMSQILEQLRQQYDFIVVDTPPVLPVADTLLIGQHVDAALFSILREVSRVPKVYDACERLAGLGVRILGAVVAGARLETHGSDYYYTAAYASHPATPAAPPEDA